MIAHAYKHMNKMCFAEAAQILQHTHIQGATKERKGHPSEIQKNKTKKSSGEESGKKDVWQGKEQKQNRRKKKRTEGVIKKGKTEKIIELILVC